MENDKTFNQIINEFKKINNKSNNIITDIKNNNKNISIKPTIISNKFNDNLKIEFYIGESEFYKIKSLPEFYNRFNNKESYKYGPKLEFTHIKDYFKKEDIPLLDYILKYAEIIKYANEASNGYEYYTNRLGEDSILISNTGIDELFEILENKFVTLETEKEKFEVEIIPEEPDIKFNFEEKNDDQYMLHTDIQLNDYRIYKGKEYTYILLDKKIYRCSKKYEQTVLTLLEIFRKNFTQDITFSKKQLGAFFSIIEPHIKDSVEITEDEYEKIKQYKPLPMTAKIFLDYNEKNYILADVRFIYGNTEINPLDLSKNVEIIRNDIEETTYIDMLVNSGFMLDQDNNRLILADEEKIYNFLSNDIEEYLKKFEVLATDKFKSKQVKKTENISIGVKIENNLLDIEFKNFDFDKEELQEIMRRYRLKKKYYRMKDGNFIELENNKNIEFIENITKDIDINYLQILNKKMEIPLYRSFYLEKILDKNESLNVTKDENYEEFIEKFNKTKNDNDIDLPKNLTANLREYQKVGYNWLKTLDEYGLGGILADDMGLGKTVQLLSVVCSYKEKNKNTKPTLVVCPSSLALNWESEINKFTKNIKTLVIHGNLEERKKQIKSIPKYDITITSYELLKRDIDEYKKYDYQFKYIVADEAQYIKNNNTKNARAIKEIKSDTRFALTGTPIENSLSELWSIFDFIMPGYLFSYRKFKELYETEIVRDNNQYTIERLKELISPFVLRRIKGEVLTELPDKTISILNSQMDPEQREIYMAYLAKAKKDVEYEISENGIEKSQMKILALLTRLRQICCHPSLFISNYSGESGKLNQCIEIVKDAIEAGHKILLFSGYTSMFDIIEKKLKEENIKYSKLTGQTQVSDRLNLVNDFNSDNDIKVFLVSLKAGGTGLNLTGADMVIHYDPWWNLSAENQATDRTYRIGQKKNVQVYKLITKDSIEEKIYELQKRKEVLIDNMLSTNQTFISKLSKEDIMKLFE